MVTSMVSLSGGAKTTKGINIFFGVRIFFVDNTVPLWDNTDINIRKFFYKEII